MVVEEERIEAATRNSVREKGKSKTAPSTWLGGAVKGSLLLCYTGPLAEKWKSEISGKQHRPKPIPWERNS